MRTLWMAAALAALSLAACSDNDPVGPGEDPGSTLTVDAAESWAYVALSGDEAKAVTVSDPATSLEWQLGFYATSVMLNGGAAGSGSVVGHCLCLNAAATDEEVQAMTPESTLAEFEAVTAAEIPTAEEAWQSDALAPVIDGWYSYDPSTHAVSAVPENVWKVRSASGQAFAKVHVTGVEGATRNHAGTVTVEFAVQASAGEAFGPTQTVSVDLSAGAAYLDLETGVLVSAADEWDLWLEGYEIRVNGGVSGSGEAGAVLSGQAFGAVDDASNAPARVYAADTYGGVFEADPWYRYNLDGAHQVWPTYDVYLIQTAEGVYKVQLTGYYGPTGDSPQITFRYARLQ